MKFLSILSAFIIFINGFSFTKFNVCDGGGINLNSINLKKIDININGINQFYKQNIIKNDQTKNQKRLFSYILDEEIKNNRIDFKLEKKLEIIKNSYITTFKNWEIELPSILPKMYDFSDFKIIAKYNNDIVDDLIINSKLYINVRFINKPGNKKLDIWDILTSKDLNIVEEDFYESNEKEILWKKIFEKNKINIENNKLNYNDFDFIKIDYNEAIISPKLSINNYDGIAIFNYNAAIDISNLFLKTKSISVSTDWNNDFNEQISEQYLFYTPLLGKNSLINSYKKINYSFKADLLCTGLPLKKISFNSGTYISESSTYRIKTFPMITGGGYNEVCSLCLKTNLLEVRDNIFLETEWIGEKLLIKLKIRVCSISQNQLKSGSVAEVSNLCLNNMSFSNVQ